MNEDELNESKEGLSGKKLKEKIERENKGGVVSSFKRLDKQERI